ncbi:double-stranded DNA 3'-5' exodeoxyribonuclease [Aureococcus anophagefferens]|uniref:Double-stranded DNA 3'-5' exodeoxyribonuclease n=1 Tax=Aureococcus anophagefferens TaxID=44056 RepID=A0ABR1GAZ8_AURAN
MTRTTKAKKGRSPEEEHQAALRSWLERLRADVVCLQEVKLKRSDVEAQARLLGAAADDGSWETYWCCNDGKARGQRAGLNGVATLVRGGAFGVLRADAKPLGDPDFDDEGRCLVTEHGGFVLFNVYVPNAGGGARVAYKMAWLRALRSAMDRERAATGKPAILAGDLNAKMGPNDSHWTFRSVDCGRLAAAAAAAALDDAQRASLEAAAAAWPAVRARALEKLGGAHVPRETMRRAWARFAPPPAAAGRPGALPASSTAWLLGLRDVDGMVDSLDALHPQRSERFTCWHQYHNKRYERRQRADHALVDRALFEAAAPVAGALDAGLRSDVDANTARAARGAAVLDGRWAPAGFDQGRTRVRNSQLQRLLARPFSTRFDGGGLRDGRASDYLHHSSHAPHTGIRYTPPTWSDHVAATLCLGAAPADAAPRAARAAGDAQPHAKVRTITQFFSAAKPGAKPSAKPKPPPPPKRKSPPTIRDFFAKKPKAP